MKIHNAMSTAQKVLQAFLRRYHRHLQRMASEVSIEAYRNGRENGYVVYVHFNDKFHTRILTGLGRTDTNGNAVTFSENRNSDEVALYPGDFAKAAFPSRIADEIYRDRAYTPAGKYEVAARVAAHFLNLQRDDRLITSLRP